MLYLKIASIKTLRRIFFFVVDLIEKKKFDLDLSLIKNRKRERKIDFLGDEKIKCRGSSNV